MFLVDTIGSTVYTCMLNRHGGVEADLTVSAIEPGSGTSVHDPAFHGMSASILVTAVNLFVKVNRHRHIYFTVARKIQTIELCLPL